MTWFSVHKQDTENNTVLCGLFNDENGVDLTFGWEKVEDQTVNLQNGLLKPSALSSLLERKALRVEDGVFVARPEEAERDENGTLVLTPDEWYLVVFILEAARNAPLGLSVSEHLDRKLETWEAIQQIGEERTRSGGRFPSEAFLASIKDADKYAYKPEPPNKGTLDLLGIDLGDEEK